MSKKCLRMPTRKLQSMEDIAKHADYAWWYIVGVVHRRPRLKLLPRMKRNCNRDLECSVMMKDRPHHRQEEQGGNYEGDID